jgi:hypothetical protein
MKLMSEKDYLERPVHDSERGARHCGSEDENRGSCASSVSSRIERLVKTRDALIETGSCA